MNLLIYYMKRCRTTSSASTGRIQSDFPMLLPHLLECDVTELFETCGVFADSPQLKGVLIPSDESDHRHAFYNYFVSLKESPITDGWLLHEYPTPKTFFNFVLGKDYLNSAWTAQLIAMI